MGGYVGKLQIGDSNDSTAFGDILYGTCRTPASTAAKILENGVTINGQTWNDFPTGFDQLMNGIQVRIKFTNGNSVVSGVKLKILGTNSIDVSGDCRCGENEVIAFTFEENVGGTSYWRVTSGGVSSAIQSYVSTIVGQVAGSVDNMIFKGTIGTGGNPGLLPTNNYKRGETYRIVSAGTYANQVCEVGDLIIAINDGPTSGSSVIPADWTVAQTNIDGAVTAQTPPTGTDVSDTVAIFDGSSGKAIKSSGFTIESSVPQNAVFTDTNTSYRYQLTGTTPVVAAYTGCSAANSGGTVIAAVSNGVLQLTQGLTFTTANAMPSGATLTETTVAGPSLT